MSRLVLALIIAVGLCAPGAASAQVWKLKKAKTATTNKAPAKKKAKSTSSIKKKKKKRSASKASRRKVDLVPEESESSDRERSVSRERVEDDPADEPIIIQVEEL